MKEDETEIRYIVVQGNPFDDVGFTCAGPFDTASDANDWAESIETDWWIVKLYPPNYGG